MTRHTLRGWAQDLARDGVRHVRTRADVVGAVRRVMLSAHRDGVAWPDVHAVLTDTHGYRLAVQIATGRGGRQISRTQREAFLRRHWQETRDLVAARPPISRDDALAFLELVADELEHADLPDRQRAIVEAALTVAGQHGTTRVALPVRTVVALLAARQPPVVLSRPTAHRALMSLCEDGEWLELAERGTHHASGRGLSNLYRIAPPLLRTHMGATPPESHRPPVSHPPVSHPEGVPMTAAASLNVPVTPEEVAALAAYLADMRRAASEGTTTATPEPGNVVPLRRRGSA